jgi:sec-independent protein translocase protein TatA
MLLTVLLFIGTTELLVIAALALLIFGGKKLPELMRGLGKGVKEFKEGMKDSTSQDSKDNKTAEEEKSNEAKQ